MRLKSFYAKTVTEAMQMIRETLGEDAIIVATREENGGRSVRVTAAIDRFDDGGFNDGSFNGGPAFELGTPEPSTPARRVIRRANSNVPDDYLQYDAEEDAEDAIHELVTDTLLRHGMPSDISDMILSSASMSGMMDPVASMRTALEGNFGFSPLPLKSRKALMLIGAPGAGKTLATAKLAARATLTGLRAAVITTDTVRAGGVEQLEAFTKLLQIPLQKARNGSELRARLEASQGADLILVDTGGCNPFDVDDMRAQAGFLDNNLIEPVLVMAAGGDAEESGEIARCFAVLGVQRLLPTRLDIARRLGGLFTAAGRSGIAFSDASNTPKVADGIVSLSAQSLSNMLLPKAARARLSRTGMQSQPNKSSPKTTGPFHAAKNNTRRTG